MLSIIHTLFFQVIHSENKTLLHMLNLWTAVVSNWAVTYLGMYTVLYVLHSVRLQALRRSNPAWHFDSVCSQKLQIQSNLLEAYEKIVSQLHNRAKVYGRMRIPRILTVSLKGTCSSSLVLSSYSTVHDVYTVQEHLSVALVFWSANI